MSSPVGILAGGGGLPLEAADAIRRSGRSVHVVGIAGEADPAIAGWPHTWVNWGGIGAMLRAFRDADCTEIVIIGGVRRPDLVNLRPDAGFFLSLPLLLRLMSGGDDSVLRRVVKFFERKGFKVRGVHEVAPALLAAAGLLAGPPPSETNRRDIDTGLALIEALGSADIGQAVVVASGRPIAIEAAEGTDGILQRVADLRRRGEAGTGGVLVKAAKPGQELRVDLPAVGPKTVELAASAGLAGIAVLAGAVLLAERKVLLAAADRYGLFLVGAEPSSKARRRAGGLSAERQESAGLSVPRQLGEIRCRARDWRDVRQGLAVAAGAAAFGAGAAVVVARGHVLAVEAGEGPEEVVARAGRLRQWGDARSARRRRGVLVLRSAADLSQPLMDKAVAAGLAAIVFADSAADSNRLSALVTTGDRTGVCLLGSDHHEAEPVPATDGLRDRWEQSSTSVAGGRRELRIFLVAGEHSGDALGAKLIAAIKSHSPARVRFAGVGGELMAAQGLVSPFPLSDVAIMGPLSILPRLPRILRRVYSTVDAAVAAEPDAVVIIDSPEFTHPIAKRIKKHNPSIPIIDYVSPQLWAWRPGRAKKMRAYVDHVLALLPFEPEAHARLGGPPCSYVGHPLIERLEWVRDLDPVPLAERLNLDRSKPVVAVLPGSRTSEVSRLMQPFGEALALLRERGLQPEVVIPTVPHLRGQIEQALAAWQVPAHLVHDDNDKFRAFKLARAALAASGTVTLELGLVGTPMVVAYRVDAVAARLRFLVKVPSVVLANLVLAENVFPEFIQEACVPERLADAVAALLADTPERERQLAGLARIPERLRLAAGSPSEAAAAIVLRLAREGRTRNRP
jgi:lipid-A-disaccharide synthase